MLTMVTCAAPRYLQEHGEPMSLAELDAHRGVTFLSGQNQRPRPVSVLYPSRSHLAPQVEAFVHWLVEQLPKLYGHWLAR